MDLEHKTTLPRAIGFPLPILLLTPLPSSMDARAVDVAAGDPLSRRCADGVSGL
jgi:hypothetical protein